MTFVFIKEKEEEEVRKLINSLLLFAAKAREESIIHFPYLFPLFMESTIIAFRDVLTAAVDEKDRAISEGVSDTAGRMGKEVERVV